MTAVFIGFYDIITLPIGTYILNFFTWDCFFGGKA
jgi:hypothetical protein